MAVRVNALTLITATRCAWGGGRGGCLERGRGSRRCARMERGVKGGAVRLARVDTAYDSELFGSEAEDDGGQGVAQREALHVEDLVGAQQHAGRGRLGVERGAELAQQLRRAGR